MRSFVSFKTDFSNDTKAEDTPGQELAQYLCEGLCSAGFEVKGPQNREDWAWDFLLSKEAYQIESIVGYVDDDPIQWLITTHLHLSFWKKLFGGASIKTKAGKNLRSYCQAIHQLLSSDNRFRSVRWYEQQDFDQNLTDKWEPSP